MQVPFQMYVSRGGASGSATVSVPVLIPIGANGPVEVLSTAAQSAILNSLGRMPPASAALVLSDDGE